MQWAEPMYEPNNWHFMCSPVIEVDNEGFEVWVHGDDVIAARNDDVTKHPDYEDAVRVRVDAVRKVLEQKLEHQDKLIRQLLTDKEKAEYQIVQQQKKFSQEIATLQDQARVLQKQLDIGRTEKASAQIDLDTKQKKLDLVSAELRLQFSKQQQLNEQVAQMEEARTCKICFERPVDTVLFPCSHICLCSKCTVAVVKKNKKCPICRSTIERSTLCYF